jgi:hypothetical protein
MMNASLSDLLLSRGVTSHAPSILRQLQLRLVALSRLFSQHTAVAASLGACAAALASSPAAAWPAHVSALHAAALAHVPSLRGAAPPGPRGELDALLHTLAVAFVCAGEAASCAEPPIAAALGVRAGEVALSRGESPLVATFDLRALLQLEVDGVRALAVEKFSAAPPVELRIAPAAETAGAPPLLRCVAAPALLRHGFAELLKNAVAAQVAAFGAGGVEDAPPIEVTAEAAGGGALLRLAVRNVTGRAPPQALLLRAGGPFPYFASPPHEGAWGREPTYHYSRDFGVPFCGAGVGVPRAHLYGVIHGGGLLLRAAEGGGLEAALTLRRDGGGGGLAPHPLLL